MHRFVNCLSLDVTNFYWNQFVFDRDRGENKSARFFLTKKKKNEQLRQSSRESVKSVSLVICGEVYGGNDFRKR